MSGARICQAFVNAIKERFTASEGKTFTHLKQMHSRFCDDDLKLAISKAVKLDSNCDKNFSYRSANYLDDCKRAMELAKLENPGFSDKTYKYAEHYLRVAMR